MRGDVRGALLLGLMLAVGGCFSSGSSSASGTAGDSATGGEECTPGALGCACEPDGSCMGDLDCNASARICVDPDCVDGTVDCPCTPTTSTGCLGDLLVCDRGICKPGMSGGSTTGTTTTTTAGSTGPGTGDCPPGSPGCACLDAECDANLTCYPTLDLCGPPAYSVGCADPVDCGPGEQCFFYNGPTSACGFVDCSPQVPCPPGPDGSSVQCESFGGGPPRCFISCPGGSCPGRESCVTQEFMICAG